MVTQQDVPPGWPGSRTDFVAYEALLRAGKRPGDDFTYQPKSQGSRMDIGSQVDFLFRNPPDLALQVQESFYNHDSGIETAGSDILKRAQFAGFGVNLILLEHDKLIEDPDWIISEALQYRDHSRG